MERGCSTASKPTSYHKDSKVLKNDMTFYRRMSGFAWVHVKALVKLIIVFFLAYKVEKKVETIKKKKNSLSAILVSFSAPFPINAPTLQSSDGPLPTIIQLTTESKGHHGLTW